MMQLSPGEYFGRTLWQRRQPGLQLTLSAYSSCRLQPWHRHVHPTFFILLEGEHRDYTRQARHDQAAYTFVYHPTTTEHAGELGRRSARGLNIEYEPDWLARHQLQEADLGSYRVLHSARAQLDAFRFLATAFHDGPRIDAELEAQAFELLVPLVECSIRTADTPRWLPRALDFLHARFRDAVSLRDVALEAGVHPVYLARIFRRRHGCNVSEYLRTLRLAEAARLVVQGAPLALAAHAAGFADQAHLCRSCSRAVGFSPKRLYAARQAFRKG
jgi:AraC family transcriptional regulator